MLKAIRFFGVYLWILLVTVFSLPVLLILWPFSFDALPCLGRIYGLLRTPILGIKVEYENKQGLKGLHSSLLISNHQHTIDILILGPLTPRGTVVVGKKQILFIPFFGLIFWLTGNIFIDRSSRKKAIMGLERCKAKLVNEQKNIWLMPEGTRSNGRGLLPFKKGPFYLAIQAQVPICPIVVSEFHRHLDFNSWSSGTVKVAVLSPIITKGLTLEDVPRLQELAQQKIQEKIEQMNRLLG